MTYSSSSKSTLRRRMMLRRAGARSSANCRAPLRWSYGADWFPRSGRSPCGADTHPVVAQVEAPHVGMVDEADTEEVEHFALVQLGPLPDVADRRQTALLAARGEDFQYDVFSRRGRFEVIDAPSPLRPSPYPSGCAENRSAAPDRRADTGPDRGTVRPGW